MANDYFKAQGWFETTMQGLREDSRGTVSTN